MSVRIKTGKLVCVRTTNGGAGTFRLTEDYLGGPVEFGSPLGAIPPWRIVSVEALPEDREGEK